jgi:hypothetical protein
VYYFSIRFRLFNSLTDPTWLKPLTSAEVAHNPITAPKPSTTLPATLFALFAMIVLRYINVSFLYVFFASFKAGTMPELKKTAYFFKNYFNILI